MTRPTRHIALVCPGGPISHELAASVRDIAAAHCGDGIQLHYHPQCFASAGHFAGTDAERGAAFLEMANDPQFDAIWFARGGYGACRIDPAVFGQLNEAARRKTYLGYSDAGFLLGRLYREGVGAQAHGPMPADLPRPGGANAIRRALDFLAGSGMGELDPSSGEGQPVLAFNITVLAHMIATDWAPPLAGHVVLLEDVGEYLYRIDRALFAITHAPAFAGVAGVRLGRISETPENDRPFGQSEEEIVRRWCEAAGIPYLGRADIGHDAGNKIVPFGPRPEDRVAADTKGRKDA